MEFGEQTLDWRVAPPRGAIDVGKPYLPAPGYLRKALNFVQDRRTLRRRPFRRRVNHTAVGASGIRLRREAFVPWSLQSAFSDADFSATERDFTLEFWFRAPSVEAFPATGDHRVPVAFLGSRAAEALGYGGGPGYTRSRTVDAPLTLNLARLSGDWYWELYGHPGSNRIAVAAAPYIRQHVAVVIDKTGSTMSLRNSDDGEGNEVTASMALAVNATRQAWRFRGPAEKADQPENPPYFELECIRMWHTARTASEIQDNRNFLMEGDEDGLAAQWTGDKGTRDYLESSGPVEMPMFFSADYPAYYAGAAMRGVEIAAEDRSNPSKYVLQNNDSTLLDSMTDALATTYDGLKSTIGGAFYQTELQYAVSVKLRLLETNLTTTSAEFRGITTGQFEIAVEPTTGKVYAYDNHQTGFVANSGATTIKPGESYVISVERDGSALYLYIDGTLVATVGGLSTASNSAFVGGTRYGNSVYTNSVPGGILVEEIVHWYGKPNTAGGTHLITAYPSMGYTDSIDRRVSGGLIEFFGSFEFTNGSNQVETDGAGFTPRSGDFLVVLTLDGRRVAYRVVSKTGSLLTINTNHTGESGTIAVAVTRALFHQAFDNPWSTQSNQTMTKTIASRTGNQNLLPNVIDDRFQVMRPLWLANGVTSSSATTASSHLERTTRFAGLVKGNKMPAGAAFGYQREDQVDARLVAWGTSLFWAHDGWWKRGTGREGGGDYALLHLEDGFLYPSNGTLARVFDDGTSSLFHFTADLEPSLLTGKRALFIKGRKEDQRQLWLYIDEGKVTAKIFYDNSGEQNVVLQTDRPCLRVGAVARVDVVLDFDNVGNSYIAVDQVKLETTTTGTWGSGSDTINSVPDEAEGLFGVNRLAPDVGALEDEIKGFVGWVHQVRMSGAEEITLNEGLDDPGALQDSADTDLLLLLEEGKGWSLGNTGTNKSAVSALNEGCGLVPILEDIPHGDDESPYSIDQFRATAYGTNGGGRQFYAKWTGDFEVNPNGWETGFSGILPPLHFPRVYETATAATENTAGDYLVAYAYVDTKTGQRSNPSPIFKLALSGAFKIEIEDLQASEDPRVDGIEVYMSQVNGSFIGKVALVGNEAQSVVLDYAPSVIRAGDELKTSNGVPPEARLIKFIGGRAYWAGVEGSEGVLSFSQFDFEESWDALNQKQIDSATWSPISGIGGQRGAVHVYTRDSIFRAIDGGGDLTSFQFREVVSGVGAIDQFTLIDVDGIEMFMSRDGLFAFDGASTKLLGEPTSRQVLGVPGVGRGLDPRAVPMWGVWDAHRHLALWFYRGLDDSFPTGKAIAMSRRVNDSPAWSELDFYDVSAAATYTDIDGIAQVMLADSMGYLWVLEDPTSDTQDCLDLDGLNGTLEDGTSRTLTGTWSSTSMLGHVAGDGARGYVYMGYTEDTDGLVTGYGLNRLLRTPAAATLVAGDVEGSLGSWSKFVLGGFPQVMESHWGPFGAIEAGKRVLLFDMGYSPLAGEVAMLVTEAVVGNSSRFMNHEIAASAPRKSIALDDGYLEGIPMRESSMGRAFRWAVQYFGRENLDVAETNVRWSAEGGAGGPGA